MSLVDEVKTDDLPSCGTWTWCGAWTGESWFRHHCRFLLIYVQIYSQTSTLIAVLTQEGVLRIDPVKAAKFTEKEEKQAKL